MVARNACVDRLDFMARHAFRVADGFLDGLDGLINIHHNAHTKARGRNGADTNNINTVLTHFANDGTHLCSPNIKTYNEIVFGHALLLMLHLFSWRKGVVRQLLRQLSFKALMYFIHFIAVLRFVYIISNDPNRTINSNNFFNAMEIAPTPKILEHKTRSL